MKIIIIGNGIAGQNAADLIRKQDPDSIINIYTKEKYSYYSRIFLPQYIINEKKLEKLILRKDEWYKSRNINLNLGSEVQEIYPEKKTIKLVNREEIVPYDKLILATGSNARFITFGSPNIEGMYALRNINDADTIKKFIQDHKVKEILIIGGGLLGIELGYNLHKLQLKVSICEINDYLLSRQLDKNSAKLLQKYLVSKGINIICGKKISKILGNKFVEGIVFDSGESMKIQMILQQMGIIPEITIARQANLNTERGIIVNEYLQTSNPDIYAVGDCVQFNGSIWGIIPASLEQSNIAVQHILNRNPKPYNGTFWKTRLKIAGIKLSCLGAPPPSKLGNLQMLENINEDAFICRKVILDKNILKGAILMGEGKDNYFVKNLGKEVDIEELKKILYKK